MKTARNLLPSFFAFLYCRYIRMIVRMLMPNSTPRTIRSDRNYTEIDAIWEEWRPYSKSVFLGRRRQADNLLSRKLSRVNFNHAGGILCQRSTPSKKRGAPKGSRADLAWRRKSGSLIRTNDTLSAACSKALSRTLARSTITTSRILQVPPPSTPSWD